jgi:hypothetical protein
MGKAKLFMIAATSAVVAGLAVAAGTDGPVAVDSRAGIAVKYNPESDRELAGSSSGVWHAEVVDYLGTGEESPFSYDEYRIKVLYSFKLDPPRESVVLRVHYGGPEHTLKEGSRYVMGVGADDPGGAYWLSALSVPPVTADLDAPDNRHGAGDPVPATQRDRWMTAVRNQVNVDAPR